MSHIAHLPISGHIRVVRDFIEKEKRTRGMRRGADRWAGIEEAERALASLKEIEAAARGKA